MPAAGGRYSEGVHPIERLRYVARASDADASLLVQESATALAGLGDDPGGFIVTILLGVAGALVGGFLGQAMGLYGENQGAGWIMSILGAIILLALYRMVVRRRV